MGDVKLKILRFKQAIAEGDFERRRQAEAELIKGFKNLGLDEELIKYLVAHIKRLAELEKAYEEKCGILRELRETIRELARKI
jgi:hypothetical protein